MKEKSLQLSITLLSIFMTSISLACDFPYNQSTVEEIYKEIISNPKKAVANIEILDRKDQIDKKSKSKKNLYTFNVIEGFYNVKSNQIIEVTSTTHSCGYFYPKGQKSLVVMGFLDGKYSIMEQVPYDFTYQELAKYFRSQAQNKKIPKPEVKKTKPRPKRKIKKAKV